jgi:hypothetical protein
LERTHRKPVNASLHKLRKQSKTNLMEDWVVAAVNLVTAVYIARAQKCILATTQELALVC